VYPVAFITLSQLIVTALIVDVVVMFAGIGGRVVAV
jgi:hypothetical protein